MIETMTWNANLNSSGFAAGISSMLSGMGNAVTSAKGLEGALGTIAKVSFVGLVAGIGAVTAAITASVLAAGQWEKSLIAVANAANIKVGTEDFEKLNSQFKDIYSNIVTDRDKLFEAGEAYSRAGFKGTALTTMTENTLKANSALKSTSEEVSQLVIQMAALNPEAVKAAGGIEKFSTKLLSAITKADIESIISARELMPALTESAGSMSKWGLQNDISSQIALLTTMKEYGIQPDLWRTTLTSAVSGPGLAGSAANVSRYLKYVGLPEYEATGEVDKSGKAKMEKVKYTGADIGAALMGMTTDQFMAEFDKGAPELMFKLFKRLNEVQAPMIAKAGLTGAVLGEYAAKEFPKMGNDDAWAKYLNYQKQFNSEYEKGTLINEMYENSIKNIIDKLGLLGQNIYLAFVNLGEIFGPSVIKNVEWLTDRVKEFTKWIGEIGKEAGGDPLKALKKGIEDVMKKVPQLNSLLKGITIGTGALIGLSLIKGGFTTLIPLITTVTNKLLLFAGVSLSPIIGVLGTGGAIALGLGAIAAGLGIIGYSLNPEKFTTFNKVAVDALNGIKSVVSETWALIQAGDFSGAANRLKQGFTDAWNYINNIDWVGLGTDIVTMIADGVKAIIDSAFKLADWVKESLQEWINNNGPYNSGKAIGSILGKGLKDSITNIKPAEFIRDSILGAMEWVLIGLDIAIDLGRGLFDGIKNAVNPVAREVLKALITAAVGIHAEFTKTWNTIVLEAVRAKNGILEAFNQIGSSIAGYLQPAIDKLNEISKPLQQASGISPVGYYNPESGARYTPEQYANLNKERQKGVRGVYANAANASLGDYTSNAPTKSQAMLGEKDRYLVDTSIVDSSGKKITYANKFGIGQNLGTPMGNLLAGINAIGGYFAPAGWVTGGKGWSTAELGKGQNDTLNTWSYMNNKPYAPATMYGTDAYFAGKDVREASQYWGDYETNPEAYAQKIVDAILPPIKQSAIESATIEKKGAEEETNIEKKSAEESGKNFDKEVSHSAKGILDMFEVLEGGMINAATAVSQTIPKGANAAATALRLGSEVGSRFFTDAVNSVSIGLDANGRAIAVIGDVAQRQWTDAGNTWVQQSDSSAKLHADYVATSAADFKGKMIASGDAWMTIGKSSAANNAAVSLNAATQASDLATTTNQNIMTSQWNNNANILTNSMAVWDVIGGSQMNVQSKVGSSQVATANSVNSMTAKVGQGFFTGGSAVNDGLSKNAAALNQAATNINGSANNLGQIIGGFYFPSTSGGSNGGKASYSIGSSNNMSPTFNDCFFEGFVDQCTNMPINALKYTSPSGQTSYINPMTYHSTGGISNYIGGNSSSNSGLPSVFNTNDPWAASGALIKSPTRVLAGDKGEELILPAPITRTILDLVGKTNSNSDDTILVKVYLGDREVSNTVMKTSVKRLHTKGMSTQ